MSKQFLIYFLLTVTVMLAANTYASDTKPRSCWSQISPDNQVCFIKNVFRAEFEQALIDLKPLVRSQDLVIIIFSGHGSWVKDDNGGIFYYTKIEMRKSKRQHPEIIGNISLASKI